MVEFPEGTPPYPVEYKRGRPKRDDSDAVQVCAQAICLEEMLDCGVPRGALFYHEVRRRCEVEFDAPLRSRVEFLAAALHAMMAAGVTPPPFPKGSKESMKCRRCSLIDLCVPGAAGDTAAASRYIRRELATAQSTDNP